MRLEHRCHDAHGHNEEKAKGSEASILTRYRPLSPNDAPMSQDFDFFAPTKEPTDDQVSQRLDATGLRWKHSVGTVAALRVERSIEWQLETSKDVNENEYSVFPLFKKMERAVLDFHSSSTNRTLFFRCVFFSFLCSFFCFSCFYSGERLTEKKQLAKPPMSCLSLPAARISFAWTARITAKPLLVSLFKLQTFFRFFFWLDIHLGCERIRA
ncbi:hypothetical protein PHSY_006585 [Pseudozyma hubeiensis SY62]|uniref:Uncharacterized protein n=1 Tax=Pseudozyma hubeiensis (strain SY62) TaxID=1305764 RepID=R9PC48_PSEHS|nr:hypothetical protein PHSY_006585 [Pseudozyma hubeiensis SY62]GAC98988.1 hypothetical protein PHSY_006585 [Pseudozyma hubeiensis SY62]